MNWNHTENLSKTFQQFLVIYSSINNKYYYFEMKKCSKQLNFSYYYSYSVHGPVIILLLPYLDCWIIHFNVGNSETKASSIQQHFINTPKLLNLYQASSISQAWYFASIIYFEHFFQLNGSCLINWDGAYFQTTTFISVINLLT